MANLNGMGPNNMGPRTGRGQGNCTSTLNPGQKIGLGLGMGMGIAYGMNQRLGRRRGRGMNNLAFRQNRFKMNGFNNPRFQNNEESMEDYKNFLEQELERINKQSEDNN